MRSAYAGNLFTGYPRSCIDLEIYDPSTKSSVHQQRGILSRPIDTDENDDGGLRRREGRRGRKMIGGPFF